METKKLTVREWLSFLLIGLAGQMAWAIENNDINLWVYSQTMDSNWINLMTIFSAIAATLTTFLMGALSDRLGKRKPFIAFGYIVWGVSVFAFGLFSFSNMKAQFGEQNAPFMVGLFMVIMDCVMTFFGSTSNDACFNAYVTDITHEDNRGKVESVLSVLPLSRISWSFFSSASSEPARSLRSIKRASSPRRTTRMPRPSLGSISSWFSASWSS